MGVLMVPHGQAIAPHPEGMGRKGACLYGSELPTMFRGDGEEIRNRTGGPQPLRGQKAAADSERWDGRVGEGRVMVPAPKGHGVTPPPWPGLPSGTSGPVLGPALSVQAAVARIGAGPSGRRRVLNKTDFTLSSSPSLSEAASCCVCVRAA